jgi:cell wall-associated NlpC family hydrolase
LTVHDPRLNAFRADLADSRLRGKVEAARFVEGRPARIAVPVADFRTAPRADAGLGTQALLGDDVRVFERMEGWAWVQNERDGYVGYAAEQALAEPGGALTHVVRVPRTFVYPGPDLKLPRMRVLSMGCRVGISGFEATRGTLYGLLAGGGAIVAAHLSPLDSIVADYVDAAEQLVGTPYLWGGASAFGMDCSGLVQLAMLMAGRRVLRDSDMQAATLGERLEAKDGPPALERGDLVFWKGHVAIMVDAETVLHASGHSMTVEREPLKQAIARIEPLYGMPTVYRRP